MFVCFDVQFIGLALAALGIYLLVNGLYFNFITDSDTFSGSVFILVTGLITIVVVLMGILGVALEAAPLLAVVKCIH